MRRFGFTGILLFSSALLFGQPPLKTNGQPRPILHGVVIGQSDSLPIPHAHIINLSRARGTAADEQGRFALPVSPGDHLRFQSVGFDSLSLAVTKDLLSDSDSLVVILPEKITELPGVTVWPYATFAEFRHAFLNFKDPEPELSLHLPELSYQVSPEDRPPGLGVVIPGPITFLYEQFSRRGRSERNYQRVLAEEAFARRAARVVNPDVVRELTGLQDEEEIHAFLLFCGMSHEYIANARESEVYQQILHCYRQYSAGN